MMSSNATKQPRSLTSGKNRRSCMDSVVSTDSTAGLSNSVNGSSVEEGTNIWTRLLARRDAKIFDDDYFMAFCDEEYGEEGGEGERDAVKKNGRACSSDRSAVPQCLSSSCMTFRVSTKSNLATLRRHPRLPLMSLVVFAICTGVGLSFVSHQCAAYEKQMLSTAKIHATEAMEWFSDAFDQALAPLFALAQVVKHDQQLCELTNKIGNRGDEGALPGWPEEGKEMLMRDVRGVCDEPGLQARFAEVAESVKRDSGLGKVITGLRVAPAAVMCMIHPLINYEDYTHVHPSNSQVQPYYNGTKRLYNDWAWDKPNHINVLRKTFQVQEAKENRITITGPFKMKSAAGDGTILTESLFCTHLGVSVPNHTVRMIGEGKDAPPEIYDSWGFVMSFVNWQYMVDQSRIHDRFEKLGMVYMLNRTFEYDDHETGEKMTQNDQIAWTPGDHCVSTTKKSAQIQVSKSVNGDDWTLTAGYLDDTRPTWETPAIVAVVLASALISALVLSTLLKNQQHKDLLYKMMPKGAIRKLNRGQTVVEKYSCVTIFFSDIVGFTSMAGEMSPVDVMDMLNALYVEFDKICKKHECYKVETIGDAYMVVGGAPDRCSRARASEKVAMFALEAMECVENLQLPKGGYINIRAGIASGPVVAGVVGDAMPRYCLFGDTVNFASRMESTSKKNKIQVCDLTKSLLTMAPSQNFDLKERRDDKNRSGTMVKGKGWTETWWLTGSSFATQDEVLSRANESNDSQIHGMVPLELSISSRSDNLAEQAPVEQNWAFIGQDLFNSQSDEPSKLVTNLLEKRLCDLMNSRTGSTQDSLPADVLGELQSLVNKISSLYNDVHFHNFEHACHVTLSMNGLLDMFAETPNMKSTYPGLSWSNELVALAMVFAALTHDIEHLGVTNKMLEDQGHYLAKRYTKSIAESNSIDVAIDLLLSGDFSCLREAMFKSQNEKHTFCMLVRVAVTATDIASKDNMSKCKELSECAYGINKVDNPETSKQAGSHAVDILAANDLGASQLTTAQQVSFCQNCSLLQQLMQVADISHCTQSLELCIRWNYRLYKEVQARETLEVFQDDQCANWAKDNVGFFDFYIVPLVSRLCQVSGPDSIDTAVLSAFTKDNRNQWETLGKEITEIMANGVASGEDEEATVQSILLKCSPSKKVSWEQ